MEELDEVLDCFISYCCIRDVKQGIWYLECRQTRIDNVYRPYTSGNISPAMKQLLVVIFNPRANFLNMSSQLSSHIYPIEMRGAAILSKM